MKTPQQNYPALAKALNIQNEVWLKREDLHKYGSHKGRSIPLMINEYRRQGITNFVISSSGNAALAATMAVDTFNKTPGKSPLTLTIYVGKNIELEKLKLIKNTIHDTRITIQVSDEPKHEAFQTDKKGEAKNLRQSTDDLALVGYHELAGELAKIPNLSAVFIPTSSGTIAQGLYEGFGELNITTPQIHIVQTEECHPMVSGVIARPKAVAISHQEKKSSLKQGDSDVVPPSSELLGMTSNKSLASAIVDNVAHRKQAVSDILKNTGGAGWVANNKEITDAMELVKNYAKINISPNSALSVVGLKKAVENGYKWAGPVVCLVTGR